MASKREPKNKPDHKYGLEYKHVMCHNSCGFFLFASLFLGLAGFLFFTWITDYAAPLLRLVKAECLVISAEQEIGTEVGFQGEKMYR
jgi:hypothetical protein